MLSRPVRRFLQAPFIAVAYVMLYAGLWCRAVVRWLGRL